MAKVTKDKKKAKREKDPLQSIKVTLPGLPGGVVITDEEVSDFVRRAERLHNLPDWKRFLPNPFKEL